MGTDRLGLKAGYRVKPDLIEKLALYFAKEFTFYYYRQAEGFDPHYPRDLVKFFFESLDALLEEFSSQNEDREAGILLD